MQVRGIIELIERLAPPALAASWDHSGLQVAGTEPETGKLAVTLDPTPDAVSQALAWGAGMVLAHHPLSISPRMPDRLDGYHQVLSALLTHRAWLYSSHTPLDCAPGGPAAWLAQDLGLTDLGLVQLSGVTPMVMAIYKEVAMDGFVQVELPADIPVDRLHFDRDALRHSPQGFICPEPHWPRVKASLEASGAVSSLAGAMRLLDPTAPHGFGLMGRLPQALDWPALADKLWDVIPRSFWTLCGQQPAKVDTVAYCPGSGGDLAAQAFKAGAQVFITGDVKYHQALENQSLGLIVDVGHFALEEEMMRRLAANLSGLLAPAGVEVRFFPGADPMRVVVKP